jgi:DNA repair ATPase RecN
VLIEMRLENYAVIDHLVVEFGQGLNLLTGETGAGKSILVDALALLLGDKASSDVIRAGAQRAVVSAVFEVEGAAEKPLVGILEANGLDESDDGTLILRREIAAGGKGRVFVNNQPATVAVLRLLAPHLATIHAQNESLLSFDGPARLELLDAFAGSQLESVETTYAAWKEIRTRIEELEQGEQDRLRLVDLWIFQKREIEEGRLQSGEDERLEGEKRVLANAERIYNAAMNKDEILRGLRAELAKAAGEYLRAARALSKKRAEAARRLEKLVEAEINDLAMKSAFRIEMTSSEEEGNWTGSGIDQVVYMISTNPGEPLRQLEHIASGGELSRVMLALKASVEAGARERVKTPALSQKARQGRGTQRTLVFDEIDTGIGGRAAEAVGKKLKSLARSNQVLCVTHLPQIATFGDHHYVIEKKESGGRTRTSIRAVTGEERTEEVARMLSGAKLTETSRKHAEQMIKANA